MESLQKTCEKIAQAGWFQWVILSVILVAAALVGVETYAEYAAAHSGTLSFLNELILWIFVVEALIKMAAHGRRFFRYFRDPWNVFDFVIVAVCFLPADTQFAAVLRLARIMRALRLMTALPQLQMIVGALIKSIPSMGYVGILLGLNFYVYAVLGVFLFRENDPIHFADLPTAMLTLFRVVTLEDWTDVMYLQMYGSDVYSYSNPQNLPTTPAAMPITGAAYFVTFVLFGTMIMLNLFIGVILNSMDETREERERELVESKRREGILLSRPDEVRAIENQMLEIQKALESLRLRLEKPPS